jgi:hypothetical protein
MPKKVPYKRPEFQDIYKEMKSKGLPARTDTGRPIRLRTIDATALLKTGNMPEVLTPMVVKSVYQSLSDREIRDFLTTNKNDAAEALKTVEMVDFVVKEAIADGTKVEDLTPGEKRWIFRLAMLPTEVLADFCYPEESDVEPMDDGDEVQPETQ